MTATQHELEVGEQALAACLRQTLGWKATFVPEYAERQGTQTIVQTADDAAGDINTKEHAAAIAVYRAIAAAGYGGQVTSSQCAVAAHVVYQAVLKARAVHE